ncbi:toll/interleukin-1 receptor domain-containing protein [Aquabacter sp. L1I39]|uniref:toll/interleukin-1 receptor domain-containing protein n=1 Tax=Aquabacter sp. L1I39 TaxID=2820278 RepID=UPI001ADC19DA|nr:toll/interleukin-1 receptor domain-containing protein [Aquabacter sp. L1I39]QTL05062.1 toll/interleukin-1 receptor domain-containing protein [Aquabacter sp. L1I39]
MQETGGEAVKVFLSWSGAQSRQLARILKDWLPNVLQHCEPWMSDCDISAGERWSVEIGRNLSECNFGVICVTRENIQSLWIAFEAGALSKSLTDSAVVPLLLNLEYSDIQGPLTQFQSIKCTKTDILKLCTSINLKSEFQISEPILNTAINAHWSSLEDRLTHITPEMEDHTPKRDTRDILEEILNLVRIIDQKTEQSTAANINTLARYNEWSHLLGLDDVSASHIKGDDPKNQTKRISDFYRIKDKSAEEFWKNNIKESVSGSELVDALRELILNTSKEKG